MFKGSLRTLLTRAESGQQEPGEGAVVVPLPDTLDKLRSRFAAEQARVIHEQGEMDKLDLEFAAIKAEYDGIRAEIETRMRTHIARSVEIQQQMIDALKAVNIKGEIVPMGETK